VPEDDDFQCPDCGADLRNREAGGSLIVECSSGCGWEVATTNPNTPAFDSRSYDVYALPSPDRKELAVKLGVALGRPARDLLGAASGEEPVVVSVHATEVLRIAQILAERGIRVNIRPEFPWALPQPGSSSD
jgi:hypothetical protein